MSKTYRVGFASLVHDHVWGELNRWKEHPPVEIVAAGDNHGSKSHHLRSPLPILTQQRVSLGHALRAYENIRAFSKSNRFISDFVTAGECENVFQCLARSLSNSFILGQELGTGPGSRLDEAHGSPSNFG